MDKIDWKLIKQLRSDGRKTVMPALSREHLPLGLLDLTCWLGVFGLFIASTAYHARNVNLVPTRDPRLAESLAFENV